MRTIRRYELRIRRDPLPSSAPHIGTRLIAPADVARVARELIGDAAEEHFLAFHLDVKNAVLGYSEVARGTIDTCPVDPRMVFREALILGATGLVCCHNHPSGDPTPSADDITLTERLCEGSELLGLELVDHVIVSVDGTYSLVEHRLMPLRRRKRLSPAA
jgi:DNA repair protein RadC